MNIGRHLLSLLLLLQAPARLPFASATTSGRCIGEPTSCEDVYLDDTCSSWTSCHFIEQECTDASSSCLLQAGCQCYVSYAYKVSKYYTEPGWARCRGTPLPCEDIIEEGNCARHSGCNWKSLEDAAALEAQEAQCQERMFAGLELYESPKCFLVKTFMQDAYLVVTGLMEGVEEVEADNLDMTLSVCNATTESDCLSELAAIIDDVASLPGCLGSAPDIQSFVDIFDFSVPDLEILTQYLCAEGRLCYHNVSAIWNDCNYEYDGYDDVGYGATVSTTDKQSEACLKSIDTTECSCLIRLNDAILRLSNESKDYLYDWDGLPSVDVVALLLESKNCTDGRRSEEEKNIGGRGEEKSPLRAIVTGDVDKSHANGYAASSFPTHLMGLVFATATAFSIYQTIF